MVYKNNKKGAQGIGTLIIFIALILVAAVAAGVLIQTASNLQSKALNVGTQAQQRVTTALDVVSVNAVNGGTGVGGSYGILNTSENLTVIVRLAPGSNPVQLKDMKIYFTTQSKQQILNYTVTSTINSTDFSATGDTNGYIETGNTVTLYMNFPTNISESQNFRITLLPKDGTSNPVILTTPTVMTTKIISLR